MKRAKVIYLAGVPAAGKSTIFRAVREALFKQATPFHYDTLRGIQDGPYRMLGVFDGTITEGTDRLSNAVIDDAIRYIAEQDRGPEPVVVFAEGDRLFNDSFLEAVNATLIVIDAEQNTLRRRHRERGDSQQAEFLRSRRSKVDNFCKRHGIKKYMNNTQADADRLTAWIIKTAREHVGDVKA